MSILAILEQLEQTPGRNDKIQILKDNETNACLQRAIKLALCPYTQFFIRKIPEYAPRGADRAIYWGMDQLEALSSREKTGHAARDHLQWILCELRPDNADVIERIIAKDLRCGVQASTANKVWPGLVPTYPVMLCESPTEKLLAKMKWPARLDLKYDGMRVNIICRDGRPAEIRSRAGKVLEFMGILEKEFDFALNHDCVYDGELVVVDENEQPLPRKQSNGLLTKAQRGTLTADIAHRTRVVLWDRIGYQQFTEGFDATALREREKMLDAELSMSNSAKITTALSFECMTLEGAEAAVAGMIEEGHEGGVLKNQDAPWEDKRVQHQLKFKAERDCDLRCVAINEGTGKYTGLIGSLVCESSDGILTVGVGTGLTDEDRKQPPEKYLDKIIAIVYNERIVDKTTGKPSLFLPRFIEVREDKLEADPNDRIA